MDGKAPFAIFVSVQQVDGIILYMKLVMFSAECDKDGDGNECSNHGTCVALGAMAWPYHGCRCNTGWVGPICEGCAPIVGCDTRHTVNVTGCIDKNGEPVPNSCQCQTEWTGLLCDVAQCLDSNDKPIQCANGECREGGIVSFEARILKAVTNYF